METKYCSLCKKRKPISLFYINKSRWAKTHSRCKDCDKKRSKERAEYFRNYMKENQKKYPEKWRARILARKHLQKLPCHFCKSEDSEAHHEDYSKPLDVIWVCHSCHWKLETGRLSVAPLN